MCALEFYMSDIARFLRDISEPEWFEYLSSIAPVIISILALFISCWSNKNTEIVQKKIATSENRSFMRQTIIEVYSVLYNVSIKYYIDEGFVFIPNMACGVCSKLDEDHLKMVARKNKIKLLLMGDKSSEAKDLLIAIDRVYNAYVNLLLAIKIYVANGACILAYRKAVEVILLENPGVTECKIFLNPNLRSKFLKLTHNEMIERACREYEKVFTDEKNEACFKRYLDTLSV